MATAASSVGITPPPNPSGGGQSGGGRDTKRSSPSAVLDTDEDVGIITVPTIPYVIQVPMKLDAYLNYDARVTTGSGPQSRAYVSPITSPNFQALQMKSGLIQHDIYEDLREAPYFCSSDRYRRLDGRQGIYLHWSVPRLYRAGITGSETAADTVTQQKNLGGFPTTNTNSDPSAPVFRPLPTRWVIWRTIRGISWDDRYEEDSRPKPKIRAAGSTTEQFYDYTNGPSQDQNTINDCFVVQSDIVRSIKTFGAAEDVEVTSSPYLETVGSTVQQGESFLGQSMRLSAWNGDGATPPQPRQITVSQPFNPFFADYQPQNGSVLSFFDDLSVAGSSFYTEAYVSYTVMGYHVTKEADPLYVQSFPAQGLADRLAAANLSVDPLSSTIDPTWKQNMRTICHGNMFNINWRQPPPPNDSSTSMSFPADILQQSFLKEHPLSVGTNATDALFGWLRSTNAGTGLATDEVRRNLLKLQTLVLDINDDIDSQLQAEDLLATNNFIPSAGQVIWHFKAPDEVPDNAQPTIPTDPQATALRLLNKLQIQYNALQREHDRLCSQLFAAFWRYVADQGNWTTDQRTTKLTAAQTEVSQLKGLISADNTKLGQLQSQITRQKSSMVLQAGSERSFTLQRDPTLLVAGMQSQWPPQWNENLRVRLNPQTNMNISTGWPAFGAGAFGGKVPVELQDQMAALISEAELGYQQKQAFKSAPMYYPDQDRYNGKQGWFPLFVQWEAEYYHIPFELWEFAPQGPEARIGYSLAPDIDVSTDGTILGDYRVISGRSPLLPQTGAILEANLKQVFSKINPNDQIDSTGHVLTEPERTSLLAAARALDFSSTPMTGFTDQLLTQMQGSHVIPIHYDANGKAVMTSDPNLQQIAADLRLYVDDFQGMQGLMNVTPFAGLVDIPADPSKYTPFKACIHGQFRFTKLDIVDKFGQVVRGVEQMSDISKGIGPTITPLFPGLGDSYSVEPKSDGTANVVLPRSDQLNTFVQLPPSINQPARINAEFVSQDSPPQWRQLDEWENPVRGWLVINQANISLQVFSPDGYFVREFGVTNSYPVTRPFAADDDLVASLDPIMQGLMAKFANPGWIAGFFRTLTQTIDEVQANPSSYSESMLSVLGRPLAVTAFGVSLELSDLPRTNQSTLAPTNSNVASKDLLSYNFGLKIGDKNNVFDGLFGLFTASPDLSKGLSINFNTFYSYHSPDPAEAAIPGDPSRPMLDDLILQPFYPDPHAADFAIERAKTQQVFIGIIDPFTALNIYTAILPIAQLTLPNWTIENGVSRISTFFKLGPILIPGDVAPFNSDSKYVVARDYRLGDATEPLDNGSIPVPAVGIGDWGWLQPYYDTGSTKYNLLGVDAAVEKPGFEPVPYTAVEGYLQQKQPFSKPNPMAN